MRGGRSVLEHSIKEIFARRVCAAAIGGFIADVPTKAGHMARTRRGGFIVSKARNYRTRRQSAGSGLSYERTAERQPGLGVEGGLTANGADSS